MVRILFLLLFVLPSLGFSQIWISTKKPNELTEPHPSAELHVFSELYTTGVLLPRFANANVGNITVPQHGMIVFNTDKKCFIVYNSAHAEWQEVGKMDVQPAPSGIATEGDVVYGTDENTIWWYDGTDWKEFDTVP